MRLIRTIDGVDDSFLDRQRRPGLQGKPEPIFA